MSWGKRIAEAREAAGLTQEALADMLNVVQSTLAKWEVEGREPSLAMFVAIAKFTRTRPEWLAFGAASGPEAGQVRGVESE